MHSYIRHLLPALAGLACLLAGPAIVHSYEFHLLGGMVVEGDLKDFRDGVFYLESEFGEMTINAANLDYIIVEPEDAAGPRGEHEGVLEFGLPPGTKDWAPERVDVPQALEGYSLPEGGPAYPGTFAGGGGVEAPETLEGYSLRHEELPEELRITADDYAGVMLDRGDIDLPAALKGHSLQEEELPKELRITADDYAGVMLDREGAGLPEPLEGHSFVDDEEAARSYPGRFLPEPETDDVRDEE